MPFRRQRKNNFTARTQRGAYKVAKKALYAANKIRQLINVEYKYHDTQATNHAAGWGGGVSTLTTITQGDTATNRNGNSILAKSLALTYMAYPGSTQTVTKEIRVVLVRGLDENGATPIGSDILLHAGSAYAITSHRKLDNTTDYKVIYDKVHSVMTNSANNDHLVTKKLFLKFNNHIKYTLGADTTEKGGLFLFVFTDSAASTANPTIQFQARLRYIDN